MLKGQKQIYNVNTYQKKAGMAIITSEKVNLRTGNTVRDIKGYFIIIKQSTHQEDMKKINRNERRHR